MKIYLTHCCAEKSSIVKESGEGVTPDHLYTDPGVVEFMETCKRANVTWGILSDRYAVWLPDEKHEWYEKHPDTVTQEEFDEIVNDFDTKLESFDEIVFYVRKASFHPFYGKVLDATTHSSKVRTFDQVGEIT